MLRLHNFRSKLPWRKVILRRFAWALLSAAMLLNGVLSPSVFAAVDCETSSSTAATDNPTDGSMSLCQRRAYTLGANYFDVSPGNTCDSNTSIAAANLAGSDNQQKAFNYFVAKGLQPFQAAAIVGNLIAESSVNPTSNQGGGGPGKGIAQWSKPGRWDTLVQFAGSRDPYALATQLDFMWAELNHQAPAGDYTVPLTNLNKQTNIADATAWFMGTAEAGLHPGNVVDAVTKQYISKYGRFSGYENPGTPYLDRRIGDAKGVLQNYGAGAADGSASAGNVAVPDTGSTDCTSSSDNGGTTTAQAGQGFVGNCAGQGSFASIHCGQCVEYVKWVMRIHYPPYQGEAPGNGVDVAQHLHDTYHVPLNHTPAVHSIVSWGQPYTSGSAGHVALVSQVNTDAKGKVTSIVVEDSNYSNPPDERYRKRTITDLSMINGGNYAHIEGSWK